MKGKNDRIDDKNNINKMSQDILGEKNAIKT